jgi:16S rRNA (cytidine1402-2'-O)-methyltransferase
MLYLVATPIGNLADFSFRAREVLQKVDYLLCEDTRVSHILLSHYGIAKPTKSYHRFNEAQTENQVIEDLKKGLTIALLTDAGTPGIADPGHRLVCRCIEEKIPYSALPGPSAPILALTLSGFDSTLFQFIGFLPKSEGQLRSMLIAALLYPGTTLCFESPHRIYKTLNLIASLDKNRKLAIARELTKVYEEILIGTADTLSTHKLLGELVLIISGAPPIDFSSISPTEHVALVQQEYGLSKQEAIKLVANLRQVPKREIYF